MTNLVNVTVIRTQARHEAKRGVGEKKNLTLQETPLGASLVAQW